MIRILVHIAARQTLHAARTLTVLGLGWALFVVLGVVAAPGPALRPDPAAWVDLAILAAPGVLWRVMRTQSS